MPSNMPIFPLIPIGEQYGVTCGTTVISLPSVPSNAVAAMILIESKSARFKFLSTLTGTFAATPGVGGGMILPVNDINNPWHYFEGWSQLNRMQLCGDGGDAKLSVVYLGASGDPY